MYRITKEIAQILLETVKKDRALRIGYIGPYEWVNSDADYFVYQDIKIQGKTEQETYTPAVSGLWLCKKSELSAPTGPIYLQRKFIDPFCNDEDENIDITDCCIESIPPIDRLTCTSVKSLPRLLELEPGLKHVLKKTT